MTNPIFGKTSNFVVDNVEGLDCQERHKEFFCNVIPEN